MRSTADRGEIKMAASALTAVRTPLHSWLISEIIVKLAALPLLTSPDVPAVLNRC